MKKAAKLSGSLAITAVCFWWTFKDTDWPGMWAHLREANYLWLIPYAGILTVVHFCRVIRWGNLLSGLGKVRFRELNEATSIGIMLLIVLPFRLGEFARPFLIAQRSTIRRSAAMTTVVLERIVDGIAIALLLRVLLFFLPPDPALNTIRWGANVMFAIFFGGLLFLLFAFWQQERAVRLVRATAGKISPKIAEKVAEVVDAFVGAMRHLPDAKNMTSFLFFTAVYWALNGFGMTVIARAFDCSTVADAACQPLQLSLFHGYVVLAVLVVGVMIPAAPGSAGTFQAAIRIGLGVLLPATVVKSSGLAYANVLWLAQIAQQILFGLVMMFFTKQSMKGVTENLPDESEASNQSGPPAALAAVEGPGSIQARS